MTNYRIDFPADASRCRIVKTGAAVDNVTVWPSLKMARADLEQRVWRRIQDLKLGLFNAIHTKEKDLDEDPSPNVVAAVQAACARAEEGDPAAKGETPVAEIEAWAAKGGGSIVKVDADGEPIMPAELQRTAAE